MAQIQCNFFSYALGHGVDIAVTLPSFTPCNMDQEHTHQLPEKFPVLYLLHGHGNDYMVWHRFTSIDRYAEEARMAVVTFSVGNKAYVNAELGDNFYDFLEQELPQFVENYFPISSKPEDRYIAGLSMGGYGAVVNGLMHPETFGSIGMLSAALIQERVINSTFEEPMPLFNRRYYQEIYKDIDAIKGSELDYQQQISKMASQSIGTLYRDRST